MVPLGVAQQLPGPLKLLATAEADQGLQVFEFCIKKGRVLV